MKLKKLNILAAASFLGAAILPITSLSNTQIQSQQRNNFIIQNTDNKLIDFPVSSIKMQYTAGDEFIDLSDSSTPESALERGNYQRTDNMSNIKNYELGTYVISTYMFGNFTNPEASLKITFKVTFESNKLILHHKYDVKFYGDRDENRKLKVQINMNNTLKIFDEIEHPITNNSTLYKIFDTAGKIEGEPIELFDFNSKN